MIGQNHQHVSRCGRLLGLGILMAAILGMGCVDSTHEQKGISMQSQESVTLSVYLSDPFVSASMWRGNGAQRLLSDTNLRLQYASTEGSADELLLRMVSGTIPDLIVFPTGEQAQRYLDAELLISFDDYSEMLPSVFQDSDYADALAWIRKTMDDGTIDERTGKSNATDRSLYLLPLSVGAMENEVRAMPMVLSTAWVRAGSSVVETLEDYLDLMEQMRRAQPTNPIGESMYGVCLWQEDKDTWTHLSSLAALYGIDMQTVSPLMEVNQQTGTITSMLSEDSFSRRALYFYFEANRRGLLDPDSSSQTYSNALRKAQANRIYLTVDRSFAENDTYTQLPAADMRLYSEPDHSVGVHQYIGIKKNSEHVLEAVTFLNWLYSEDTLEWLYEGEAESALMPVSPLPKTELSIKESIERKADPQTEESKEFDATQTEEASHAEEKAETIENMERAGSPDQKIRAIEAVYYVEIEPASIQRMTAAIKRLIYDAFWDMVYAEDEDTFEARWQQLVQEANEAGMAQVTDFYTQAWAAATERVQADVSAEHVD